MNDWTRIANDLARLFNGSPFWYTIEAEDVPRRGNAVNMPAVKNVIFNKNATIVYFDDGTKCIVRKSVQDEYNREHAIIYAIVKRAYGTVDEHGVVQGNGMGSMLGRLIKNAVVQDDSEQKKFVPKTTSSRFVGDDDHEKCFWCGDEAWKSWSHETSQPRDSKGRFVKKANRKH